MPEPGVDGLEVIDVDHDHRRTLGVCDRALGVDRVGLFDPFLEPVFEDTARVMHGYLEADGLVLMASDTPPGMPWNRGDNISLSIVGPDEEQLRGYFDALAEGGTVTMPMEKQFWGDTFGMATDRYGVTWMVNVGELGGSIEE